MLSRVSSCLVRFVLLNEGGEVAGWLVLGNAVLSVGEIWGRRGVWRDMEVSAPPLFAAMYPEKGALDGIAIICRTISIAQTSHWASIGKESVRY